MADRGELPAGYRRCKYLESSGKQIIVLPLSVAETTNCELKAAFTGTSNINNIIAFSRFSNYNAFYIGSNNYKWVFGTKSSKSSIIESVIKMDFVDDGKNPQSVMAHINGEPLYEQRYSRVEVPNNQKVALFGRVLSSGDKSPEFVGKIWYFASTYLSPKKYNYIPCIRVTDGTAGMFDLHTKKFESNSGSGKFGYELMDGTYVAPQ